MFRRCVAKSVEALSRIAIKRACKFALKKKLGHFILGDIDLHQLDVQLAAGVILLSDLAINVDLLNSKLSQTSIIRVKEGSIGSLSVKLPWSAGGYEVEVDELELVLYPFCGDELGGVVETNDSGVCYSTFHDDCGKGEGEAEDVCTSSAAAASVGVHQGVKTVAKWVQQLLTRFHVRVKNVIVAFDACVDNDGKTDGSHEALVLRVAEIECGTCISENDDVSADRAKAADLLGMTHLTNFLKFEGVVLDLVRMSSDVDKPLSGSAEVSASCSFKASQPLITGHKGGFGGSIKLSIPCKDGSLDIRKVDADVKVDRLIAKLQPSTLKWVLTTWDTLQNLDNKLVGSVYHMAADTHLSSSIPLDKKTTETENPINFSHPFREKTATGVLLKESQFISDWIPDSSSEEGFEEADLGASVDQFFECLDGMRSSNSVLGSSGVWGWTSSYISAITAASNIASGSLNMSVEQQLLQTNLKITFVGVSAFYSFLDEDQFIQLGPTEERLDADPNVHHLGSIWEDLIVAVQVFPKTWRLEATVDHIVLNEYMCQCGDSVDLTLHDHVNDHNSQTLMIRDLQKRVQKALPYSPFFGEPSNVRDSGAPENLKAPSSFCCSENRECSSDIVTVTLFETSGASHCLFSASSGSSDGSSTGQASLSLKLPSFVFWLSSDLVNMALDFLRNFEDFSRESKATINVSSEALKEQAAAQSSASCSSNQHSTSIPGKGALEGNVLLPHGRIFLCFPLKKDRRLRSFSSWNEFIALDFSSPSNLMELKPEVPAFVRENTHGKRDSSSPSHSMHLNVAILSLYYIIGLEDDNCDVEQGSHKFCAHRVLSLGSRTDWSRLISVVRRENAVTGAWIKKSAKLFATSDGPTYKTSSSDYEFASVSSWEHRDNLSLKEKLILSSKLCLHVCVPSTVVILSSTEYLCLVDLVKQTINAFASVGNDTDHENKKNVISQTSILVECGLVEIHLELGQGSCQKSSLERELPGSWHSLRLEVRNLEVLCVSDLGAVTGAHFLWISHSEGKLWGSVSMGADQDFMLLSFNNSSNGRGDGEGSNVLSFRPAGSKFVLMSDPDSSHDFMSVVLKCGTIIAPGGRLDWLDKLSSFFSLPSPDVELNTDCKLEKGDSKEVAFVIKLLDAALSYEPYFRKSEVNEERAHSRSHVSVSLEDKSHDPHVACVLAASSLMLSNTVLADSLDNDYRIRLQDVGLLLHEVSRGELTLDEYSAGYLLGVGYVKVAEEALLNAILKVNSEDDVSWELWCSEMNIVLRTCHDTTVGLIRLASQIQQLFAPDIEESLVHLQNRWNFFQEAQGREDLKGSSNNSSICSPGRSQSQHMVPDSNDISELAGLMGEICEDAFLLREKSVGTYNGSQLSRDLNDAGPSSSNARPESFLELGHNTKGKIMEDYCLSDLRSLSELTINSHFGEEISKSNLVRSGSLNLQEGNSGWYERPPLRIVENYVADKTERTCLKQLKCQQYDKENNGSQLYKGRVLLKNANVKWLMYAGSDWRESEQSRKICGRDGSVYLELAFINMDIQYDIFPDGGMSASKLSVSVQDFHLSDQSKNAPWRLVLGYYNSKEHPRESLSKAFKLDLEAVRPDPMTPLEEYRLRIAILPILLHLHQSQLDFLVAFFGNKGSPVEQQSDTEDSGVSDVSPGRDNKFNDDAIAEEALLPFFQKFDIKPIVARVDYSPSRVDLAALSSGKYVELVNLVPWKGVELQLKHVQAAGVYGWSNVCETALGEWLEDISQNQIHKLLKGLPTVRSFVAVGSGAAKLLSLPVKNYKKDYKLVKGLQRGTISFLRSISIEALGLGVHLVAGAHEVLLHAECILTRMQPSVSRPIRSKLKSSRGSEQPQDAQHGLQQACERLSSGLGKSASAIIHSPLKTYRRDGSAGSALVTAFKGAPAAAIAPASAAAQALHSALLGVRNSLDPERKEESMNKYLGPNHSSKF